MALPFREASLAEKGAGDSGPAGAEWQKCKVRGECACEKRKGEERGRRLRAPPPRSARRSSCSQTNCSILFTAATEQKSGYLLEYLFGIVQCHTKGVSLCWGGEKSPSPFFLLPFSFFFFPFLSRPKQ